MQLRSIIGKRRPSLSAIVSEPPPEDRVFRRLSYIVWIVSSEWLITSAQRPNGGTVIVFRSLMTSVSLYLLILLLRNLMDPTRTWGPSFREFQLQVIATLPWLGTIFAAVYAALYARFSSQWTYLANLYNQIKAAECKGYKKGPLADWKAAFIEDSFELHLSLKPLFASVIRAWGREPEVANAFVANAPGGRKQLETLLGRVEGVWQRSVSRGGEV